MQSGSHEPRVVSFSHPKRGGDFLTVVDLRARTVGLVAADWFHCPDIDVRGPIQASKDLSGAARSGSSGTKHREVLTLIPCLQRIVTHQPTA